MGVTAQLIANGIIAGSIYALVALGYTMVYGVLKFINFAHGEVYMLGAYIAWVVSIGLGLNIIVGTIVAILGCAVIGFLMEKIAYKPLRYSSRLIPLITAIALSLFFQSLALLLFGAEVRTLRQSSVESGMQILGASVTPTQIMILGVSIVLMVGLHVFLKYTKMGKAMRAVADNMQVASVIGINIDRTISAVFIIGSMLAAVGGVLVGYEQNLNPTMGVSMSIKGFTAAVVGGIGNIYGAVIGGFAIGLIENIGIWFIPSGYKDAIAFFILVLMLVLRPQGFFGGKTEEATRG